MAFIASISSKNEWDVGKDKAFTKPLTLGKYLSSRSQSPSAVRTTDPTPPARRSRPGMFSALTTRNFRIYVAGQLVSNVGSWTQRIAQDWLVLTLTGSATAVGVTTALQFLPTILLGPLGGVLADRHSKRRILLISQSVMGLCAATLAVLVLTGGVQVWHIYLLATLLGTASAVDNPTRQSFANDLVGPDLLRNAISLTSAVFQLGALVGPAISGVLISTVGIGAWFVVNAVSFAGALISLAFIRPASLPGTVRAAAQPGQVRSAVSYLLGRPAMRYPALMAGVFAFFTNSFSVTLASYSSSVFRTGPSGFALLTSLLAGGSVIGSLITAQHGTVRLRGLVAIGGALSLVQLVAAAAPSLLTLAVVLPVLGVCAVMFGVSANATVQLAAGDSIRGRVMGLYLMVVLGCGCVGGPVVGAIDQQFGPHAGLLLGGIVSGTVTVLVGLRLATAAGIDAGPAIRARVLRAGHAGRWSVVGSGRG